MGFARLADKAAHRRSAPLCSPEGIGVVAQEVICDRKEHDQATSEARPSELRCTAAHDP